MTPLDLLGDETTLEMCADDLSQGDEDEKHVYLVPKYKRLDPWQRWFLMIVTEVILGAQEGFICFKALGAVLGKCLYLAGDPLCQFMR